MTIKKGKVFLDSLFLSTLFLLTYLIVLEFRADLRDKGFVLFLHLALSNLNHKIEGVQDPTQKKDERGRRTWKRKTRRKSQ